MGRRNVIAALVALALGAGYAVLTTGLPVRTIPNTPGPSFFPWMVTGSLLALAFGLMVQGVRQWPDGTAPAAPPREAGRRAAGLVWFAIYLATLPSLGFLLATIPFFAGLMVLYGGARNVQIAVASIAMPVFLFYVFRDVFQILLPRGVLPVWPG